MFGRLNHLVYYSFPVIVNLTAIYFWHLNDLGYSAIDASLFSLAFNTFIAPIYIAIFNGNVRSIGLIRKTVYSFILISLNVMIHYFSWGVSTGMLFSPDAMTIVFMQYEFFIAIGIVFIPLIFQFFSQPKR